MRMSWIFAFSLGLAAVGIRAAEQAPPAYSRATTVWQFLTQRRREAPSPQPSKAARLVGARTLYRDVTTPDGKVIKEPYQVMAYSEPETPTNPEEIAAIRAELTKLYQKRIDSLKPDVLLEELDQQQTLVHSEEGWGKLQEVRKQLDEIAVKYEGIPSGAAAAEAIKLISNGGMQLTTRNEPVPWRPATSSPNPSPTY